MLPATLPESTWFSPRPHASTEKTILAPPSEKWTPTTTRNPKRGKNPTHSKHKKLRKLVLGLKQVGSRNDAPYDRVTGAGFVAAYNGGQYADALSKRPKASASPYSSPKPLARSQPRS